MEIDETLICNEYTANNLGAETIALKYHIGKKRVRDILIRNDIPIKKRGKQRLNTTYTVSDYKIEKYPKIEGKHYIVFDKNTDFYTTDIDNKGGVLTSYINEEYKVEIPTLYERRKYYMIHGNYWWEQWLSVRIEDNAQTKKCPYCNWETQDIDNKSGAFVQHLLKAHNKTKFEYLEEFPEDKEYFALASPLYNRQMETDENKFVVCKICGMKLSRIDNHHLKTHGITKDEYVKKYGDWELTSNEYHKRQSELTRQMNTNVIPKYKSNAEQEIINYLRQNGIECYSDRKILQGREIDIYCPSFKIGIEYNGNLWHSESYGKTENYHYDKMEECARQGISLIQFFEDEYVLKRDIVYDKLSHIFHIGNKTKIGARNCVIQNISYELCSEFLDKNHIQGSCSSTVYYGAYTKKNNELVGVMCFKTKKNGIWELTRFATKLGIEVQGLCSKFIKHFERENEYDKIISFMDRRMSYNLYSNVYTSVGFEFDGYVKPSYTYYNQHVNKYRRVHKMNFSKRNIIKRYGLDENLTEREMTLQLGYTRIWDCGLIRYVYYPKNKHSE